MPRRPVIPPPLVLDRRSLLGGLAAVACAPASKKTTGADSGGESGAGGNDTGGEPGPTLEGWELIRSKIDTVVVVMMENRSFDHFFGSRTLLDGDDEVEGLRAEMNNPLPDGSPVPVFPTAVDCLADPPHSWGSCHIQWGEGRNDGFVAEMHARHPDEAHEVMGYWTGDRLVVSHSLADHFVLADHWHCALLAGTWPNRFYLHCGQSGAATSNDLPPEPTPSVYPLVAAAGYSWSCFYNNLPFLPLVGDVAVGVDDFGDMGDFFSRAAAGTLSNVNVIEPIFGRNDDHPPAHPLAGQLFLAQIYEALRASPQWDRTLLLITYDEHGGFFDHVPPPTFPDSRADQGFGQAGFRVPTLLVSPWVKPGFVHKTPCDHTSYISLLRALFQIGPLTERDAAADPLFDIFDLEAMAADAPHAAPALPAVEVSEDELNDPICLALSAVLGQGSGQPELEAWVGAQLGGTRFDRRDQTDALYATFLDQVERAGLLRRVGRPR
jgi:phospholipase C